MNVTWGLCKAHLMELAVQDSLQSQRAVDDAIKIGRKIVGSFSYLTLACDKFGKCQEKIGLPRLPIKGFSTSWN